MKANPPYRLSALLQGIVRIHPRYEGLVNGLCLDSRCVQSGDLFFALNGLQANGRDYVNEAIDKGTVAVLCDGNAVPTHWACHNAKIPVFFIANLREVLGEIASRFYHEPSQTMTLIGVTGTNGKTSCTSFISQALTACGQSCGVIGTLGVGLGTQLTPSAYTTPDAIQLQKQLFDFKQQKMHAVAMEVSSHGLDQGRVKGVDFNLGLFTNLSRDHLDYHGTLNTYFEAKKRLFTEYNLDYGVVNADDEWGRALLEVIAKNSKGYAYRLTRPEPQQRNNTLWMESLETSKQSTQAQLMTPWGECVMTTHLMGRFNVSNCLAVLTTLLLLDIPLKDALAAITQLNPVPGRMQTVRAPGHPVVVVDFAHTPDALVHALQTLRHYQPEQLWCVFGCGGDRDQGKRPQMASVVERYADKVVVTSDNPRSENPAQIIQEIKTGFVSLGKVHSELDRRGALSYALSEATVNDIVLVAGKGHECFQHVGDQKIPFSDVGVVKELMQCN